MTVEWRGKPVWILRRTPEMLKAVKEDDPRVADPKASAASSLNTRRTNSARLKPEYLVVVGICTHLGCSPQTRFATGAAAVAAGRLARRLPLPLPRLDLRPGRAASSRTSRRPTTCTMPPYKYLCRHASSSSAKTARPERMTDARHSPKQDMPADAPAGQRGC